MKKDLTQGPILKSMLLFSLPMILGNLLQQCYNIADTLIVGRFLGRNALAAVGSSFSLMTFITSIILGLSMGSGTLFSLAISALVFVCAPLLMGIFVDAGETEVIAIGAQYLRIEGAFYVGIGCLFLFYGLYRALGRPGMSVVLTIVSLGTRVVLSYTLSAIPQIGVLGIWWSIHIGWTLADILGGLYFAFRRKDLLKGME